MKNSKSKRPLRLFVWHTCLCDWTCGVMFAYARDVAHARKLIIKAKTHNGHTDASVLEEVKQEPTVYRTPVGVAVYGGG